MREIKFRAWDKDNNRMITPFTLDDLVGGEFIATLDNCEIMQYTGLKDKNGKEIYEGDIIEYTETQVMKKHIQIIEWKREHKNKDCNDCWGVSYCGFSLTSFEGFKVIGNIYENPELLDEEELSECCSAKIVNGRCFDCKDNCK